MDTKRLEAIKLRDDDLYQRFARHLESEYKGQFVAVGLDGQFIVGPDRLRILHETVEKFGRGRFALRKIGYNYVLKWR